MTIGELMNGLASMDDNVREGMLVKLIPKCSKITIEALTAFEDAWYKECVQNESLRPWEDFRQAQDEVLKGCLQIEVSEIGKDVRVKLGMEPMTMDTPL